MATAAIFVANNVTGSYNVTASLNGLTGHRKFPVD